MIRHLLLLLFVSAGLLQCSDPQKVDSEEPLFGSSLLDELAIDSLPAFWGSETLHRTTTGVVFSSQDGYVDNRIFMNDAYMNPAGLRCLGVTAFSSTSTGIAAMEYRINNVATVILRGDTTNGRTWWYSESAGGGNAVFVSVHNTIIEAMRNGATFASVQDTLWSAVNEIVKRMDALLLVDS